MSWLHDWALFSFQPELFFAPVSPSPDRPDSPSALQWSSLTLYLVVKARVHRGWAAGRWGVETGVSGSFCGQRESLSSGAGPVCGLHPWHLAGAQEVFAE